MQMEDLDILLLRHKASFSEIESRIANHFKKIGNEVINKTLADLAAETGVSEASIYKFVKKLGFDGFQHFKISVASTVSSNTDATVEVRAFSDISNEDSLYTVAEKILSATKAALSNLLLFITEADIRDAMNLIDDSETLHFFGQGASNILALDSYHKFHRSHYRCNYISDAHMQLSYVTKLDENDCVFLFSHSGKTIETIQVARTLRKNNVKILTLTGNPNSELVELADVALIIPSEEAIFRSESLTAKVLYLTLIDILFVNVMYKDEQKNIESLNKISEVISLTRYT